MFRRNEYGEIDVNVDEIANKVKGAFSMKKWLTLVFFIVVVVFTLLSARELIETCPAGSFQVKQAAWTGNMTARMTPGTYFQLFGDIFTFPNSETLFFTHDTTEGQAVDQSIEVTFADGSICQISGTARIIMPTTEKEALTLVEQLGFRDYRAVQDKLILPTVRRALVLTANMMTAQESYSTKRPDFIKWASDQIEHGIAATTEEEKEIIDPVTGEKTTKIFKVIKKDKSGNIVFERNPLEGTGIKLKNFEVKKFKYSDTVEAQIAKQQESLMGVATAKAEAAKAEQEKLTAEAKGKAAVMTAQYEKEKEKIQAVVDAQKEKEVAITSAEKERDTAKLHRDAAEFTKQEQILLGQGEAERKRLVMAADGALAAKIEAYKYGIDAVSKAWSVRPVPAYYVDGGQGGGSASDSANMQFMSMMNTQLAKNLGLNLAITGNQGAEVQK